MSNIENNNNSSNTEGIHRIFKPTYAALKNKTTIFILTAILAGFGLLSYQQMPRELNPEIVIPYVMISTVYPGNSPVDIENLITRPIEKELKNLKGVKNVSSSSYQDMSLIVLEFETDVPVKQALQDTKDQVDKAKSELPDDLDNDPSVEDLDFEEFPIMSINLYGDYSLSELKRYAEKLQDELEGLSEISEADIQGIDEREIQIDVDPYMLEASNVSFQDIEDAIRFENVTMGAGEMISDDTRRSIRTQADYSNMNQIRNTIVKSENGNVVYLRDIGNVTDGFQERTTISRLDKMPVVSLSIVKKSGANVLDASDKVYRIIQKAKDSGAIPSGLNAVVSDDSTTYIRNQINNLENSIIMGMLLVMFILYLFMGPRNALFSGLAIPMSMFISFIIIKQMGYTLNFMVLFSMILALGMLVDNAIVVVENVYRLYSHGSDAMTATKKGVSEIAYPIISSTATTLAAFFPLVFWKGIMGEFMKYLPITLIIVLTSSLFVALILNPAFTSTFMKLENLHGKKNMTKLWRNAIIFAILSIPFYFMKVFWFGNILAVITLVILGNHYIMRPLARAFQEHFIPRMEKAYEGTLRFALKGRNPWLFVTGTFVVLVFSLMFFMSRQSGVLFFPDVDPTSVYITMELPVGTDLDRTNKVSKQVESIVYKTLEPYMDIVKSVNTVVGVGKGQMLGSNRETNKSLTTISFKEFKYRHGENTSEIMQKLTDNLSGFVGAKISLDKDEMGPPVGNPINLEISGDDFDELIKLSTQVKSLIDAENIPGIDQLKIDLNVDKPEMVVDVDRDKVRRFGLSTQQVAYALRSSLYGRKVGKYKEGEDEYDIMLRFKDKYRNNVASLMNQRIDVNGGGDGAKKAIPISAVADFQYGTTYDKINRKDFTRVITLYSGVKEGYNANEINERIRQVLKGFDVPPGYKIDFTGEQEEQADTMAFLTQALLIALSLILIILVTQFNSLIRPLIIVGTVLFSTIGVFLGLGAFKMQFVILMTGIGIISLAGIVVNNGIVLVDYIDLLRQRRKEKLSYRQDAFLEIKELQGLIVKAGKTRLRPVLLTAITTVLGLLPLAIGLNFDFIKLFTSFDPDFYVGGEMTAFWGPMSWTVIFGLVFATFLTLVIAPVMYLITVKVNYTIRKWQGKIPTDLMTDDYGQELIQ
ncbi:efflux RND transporter permease subunit [Prolixibacter sp. NT017]|uniref:efflux RND transporter permease subunit n=1 Tax=Prolixibacter sp. NT017 TaxID=2652390 RepID=UPI001272A174|nr:efflux RND transporter permease subunit [Prolixibacter sp. NT017]GET27367.1 copper transporter [Prolixibacter sp. NT017]